MSTSLVPSGDQAGGAAREAPRVGAVLIHRPHLGTTEAVALVGNAPVHGRRASTGLERAGERERDEQRDQQPEPHRRLTLTVDADEIATVGEDAVKAGPQRRCLAHAFAVGVDSVDAVRDDGVLTAAAGDPVPVPVAGEESVVTRPA